MNQLLTKQNPGTSHWTSLISLGGDISVEELPHPEFSQYFPDIWHVFLQVFVDK